jgi:hypothetical protein
MLSPPFDPISWPGPTTHRDSYLPAATPRPVHRCGSEGSKAREGRLQLEYLTVNFGRVVRGEVEHVDRGALQPRLELRVSATHGHTVVSQPVSEPTQATLS